MAEKLTLLAIRQLSICAALLSALLTTQAGYGQVPSRGYEPQL